MRCLYCGPFEIDDDDSAVDQLHAHAMSASHETLAKLDKELNVRLALGDK